MYLLIEIRLTILIQCHGNYIEVKKLLKYMLEIGILGNYSKKILGVLSITFEGLDV